MDSAIKNKEVIAAEQSPLSRDPSVQGSSKNLFLAFPVANIFVCKWEPPVSAPGLFGPHQYKVNLLPPTYIFKHRCANPFSHLSVRRSHLKYHIHS